MVAVLYLEFEHLHHLFVDIDTANCNRTAYPHHENWVLICMSVKRMEKQSFEEETRTEVEGPGRGDGGEEGRKTVMVRETFDKSMVY